MSFLLPHISVTQSEVWELHSKDHCHEEASRGKGHISERSGEAAWCRHISQGESVVSTSGLHCLFLLQRMLLHVAAMGWREYDHAICWGRWKPSAEHDLEAELSAVELINPNSTKREIAKIYCNMYQLCRSPGKMLCGKETEECIYQELLDPFKEHLFHRQLPTLPGEELRWGPAVAPRPDPQADYSARNHATYDRLRDVNQGSCKEVLALARDAHWQALADIALLEDKIERLSQSLSCSHWCSRSCRHSGSCWQRSQTVSHETKSPQVMSCHGNPAQRWP